MHWICKEWVPLLSVVVVLGLLPLLPWILLRSRFLLSSLIFLILSLMPILFVLSGWWLFVTVKIWILKAPFHSFLLSFSHPLSEKFFLLPNELSKKVLWVLSSSRKRIVFFSITGPIIGVPSTLLFSRFLLLMIILVQVVLSPIVLLLILTWEWVAMLLVVARGSWLLSMLRV